MPPFTIPTLKRNPNSPNFRCGFLQEYLQSDEEYARYFVAQLNTIHRLYFFCMDDLHRRSYRANA